MLLKWFMGRHGLPVIWRFFSYNHVANCQLKSNRQNSMSSHSFKMVCIQHLSNPFQLGTASSLKFFYVNSTMSSKTSTRFDPSIRPDPAVTFNKPEISNRIRNALGSSFPKFISCIEHFCIGAATFKQGLNISFGKLPFQTPCNKPSW